MGWAGKGEGSKQEAELAVVSLSGPDGREWGWRVGEARARLGMLASLSAEAWPGAAFPAAPEAFSWAPGPTGLTAQGSLGNEISFNSGAVLLLDFSNPGSTCPVGFQGYCSLEY